MEGLACRETAVVSARRERFFRKRLRHAVPGMAGLPGPSKPGQSLIRAIGTFHAIVPKSVSGQAALRGLGGDRTRLSNVGRDNSEQV